MSGPGNVLAGTKLISFTATPTQLRPFQTSKLEWDAVLPDGVLLSLSGANVDSTGSLVVKPFATQAYVLVAHAGPARTQLGEVTVHVDTQGCSSFATADYVKLVKGNFENSLSDPTRDPPLQFISDATRPQVKVTDGMTSLTFSVRALTGRAIGLADPEIDVDTAFYWVGSTSSDDIVPVFDHLHIDVSFPPIIRLVPGLHLDQKAEQARQAMQDGITAGLNMLGNQWFWPPKARHPLTHVTTVQVTTDEGGTITIGYCPILSPHGPVGPPVPIGTG